MDNIECSPQEIFSIGLKNCGFSIIDCNSDEAEAKGLFSDSNSVAESDSRCSANKFSLRKNNMKNTITPSDANSSIQRQKQNYIYEDWSRPQILNTAHSNHKYESNIFRKQESSRISYKFLSPDNRFSCPNKIEY